MNFRARRREEPEIILIPLIDILLMLLIFFIATTSFDKAAELGVELPKAVSKLTEKKPDAIEFSIDVEGRYYINKQQLANSSLDTVKKALIAIMAGDKNKPLIINADAKAMHQSVVTVMDAARQVGLVKLSIATTQPDG